MKISSWVTGHQVAEDNNHWDIGKIEENPMIPIDQFLEVIYRLRAERVNIGKVHCIQWAKKIKLGIFQSQSGKSS